MNVNSFFQRPRKNVKLLLLSLFRQFYGKKSSVDLLRNIFSDYGEYDFVIIGAGSTGCIVANRLSEITEWKILLLEAGTYPDGYLTGIPSMFSQDGLSDFNWGFKSVPQKYGCLGMIMKYLNRNRNFTF